MTIACGLIVASLLAGCGDDSSTEREVTIGVIAPLDSGLVDFGRGIRNAVQVAVDEANADDVIPGWRIRVRALDDSSDPPTGKAAAQRLAEDDSVIGVVGTYNSGVAREVAPVLAGAGIVMVSPGNTDPALTRGDDAANPTRPHDTYFRMVAADDVQAPFLAASALKMQLRRAAVVSETKPVSKGLADGFAATFAADGGTVVNRTVVPDGTTDFSAVVATLGREPPDLLFFGGEYQVGAGLRRQAAAAGLKAPLMGGDGLKDDAYITDGGTAAEGDFASSIGAPAEASPSAADFLATYKRHDFAEGASDFGPYAYDAAKVIIAATAKALAGKDAVAPAVRRDVVSAVQATRTTGASGPIAFDAYGDTTHKVLTLYQVTDGEWRPKETEQLS